MTNQKRLTEAQYARIAPLLAPPSNHLKIPHRQVLDAWLYVLSRGCTWRGPPGESGDRRTIYARLNRWAKAGVLARAAAALQREAPAGVALGALASDSAIIKVHAHGTGVPTNRGARRSAARAAA